MRNKKIKNKMMSIVIIVICIVLQLSIVNAYFDRDAFKEENEELFTAIYDWVKKTETKEKITHLAALEQAKAAVLDEQSDFLTNIFKDLGWKTNNILYTYRENIALVLEDDIKAEKANEAGNNTQPTGLTEEQKKKVEHSVNDWVGTFEKEEKYKDLLEEKITDEGLSDFTDPNEKEYAKKLFKQRLDELKTKEKVKSEYKSGLSKDELQKQIDILNADIEELQKKKDDKSQKLLSEKIELRQMYQADLAKIKVDESKPTADPVLGDSKGDTEHNLDEVLDEASSFLSKANGSKIDGTALQNASDSIYNILLAIGIVSTVIVGMYLALKFMFSSVEEQAKVKESLIPFIVGCVVIYGAFIIWKLAIILLRGIA